MANTRILRLLKQNRHVGDRTDIDRGPAEPGRLDLPTISRPVPGWAENVVAVDPSCGAAYVPVRREIVGVGAAIATDCGFTLRWRRAIAAVRLPLATSSLHLALALAVSFSKVPQQIFECA
jgi:hypothetical protein